MTMAIQISGAALVKVAYASSGLLSLGYNEDVVEPTLNPYWYNVPGDQKGGIPGPPIEIIFLGATATIRLQLSTWDAAVASQISSFTATATAGTLPPAGTAILSNSLHFRVLIACALLPLNFPYCLPRGPVTTGKSTKHSRFLCEFEAHSDANGLLFNNTTS